jgi:hypothetical protein
MKLIFTYSVFILVSCFFVCNSQEKSFQVSVINPNNFFVEDGYIELNIDDLERKFIIKDGADLLPFQIEQNVSGGKKICLVLNLKPNEEKILTVIYDEELKEPKFVSRTYAELAMKPVNVYSDGRFRGDKFINVNKIKVPLIHKDHDALFKYEGPGWESEKVGYRFYLDWRNATDIFGKKKNQLVLAKVGIHDTVAKDDSYHSMQEWGMDIFKVGNSLGIGSIGMWDDEKVNMVSKTDSIYCEISENGPIKSEVKTNYFGWKVGEKKFNLESKLSITAGSRLSKNELYISGDPSNIVTGLAKYQGTEYFKSTLSGEWSYIALYGNQTLVSAEDKLGIAVFYRTKNLLELSEDELSYVVKLKPENGKVDYYFCAAWEQEENAIKNLDEFEDYLNETQQLLNNPLAVEIKK